MAWEAKNLQAVKFSKQLKTSLRNALDHKNTLEDVTLVADNKYVQLVDIRKDPNLEGEGKKKVRFYQFFRTDNGEKVFEFSNYDAYKMSYNFKEDQNQNLKCLGLIVKEKDIRLQDEE